MDDSKSRRASEEKIREAQARKQRFGKEHEGEPSEVDASKWLDKNREQIRRETEAIAPTQWRRHRRKKIHETGFAKLWPEKKPQEA